MSFALGAQEDGLGVATQEFLMKIKGGNASLFLSAKSKWAIAAAGVNAVANDGKANPGIAEGVVLANANANPDSAEGVVLANSNPDPTEGVVLANANPAPAEGVVLANAGNVPIEDNDVVSVKLALNKVYGQNLKCIIKCPYPSLHGKIAVKAMHPYYAYAGDFGFLQNSKINMSVVGGVKDAGHGLQYVYDYQRHEGKFGVGYTIRSSLSAYGFTFIEPGTFKASYCQKIVDSTTTVAAVASYSPVAGDEHGLKFSLGVKHSIDPSFYVKVRAGSAGIGVALKKSFCAGKFTVKAASNVDVSDPWRRPKIGVVFSCRS